MSTLTLRPTGDSSVELNRSSGSYNYALVDESTADDADYVHLGTVAGYTAKTLTDKYTMGDHSSETGTISSVVVYARAKKGMSEMTQGITLGVRLGSTDYYGSFQTLTPNETYVLWTETFSNNPATSSAWTWSEVDNIIGLLRLYYDNSLLGKDADASAIRCSQYYIVVNYTAGWSNIKNIRMGTGSITATDIASVWFGTTEIAVADFDTFNGVTV